MSPRPGPRKSVIGYRASIEQRRGLDEIVAEETGAETTLSDVLSRAVDAELKRAAKRRGKVRS